MTRKYERVNEHNEKATGKTCKGPGCSKAARARGMCMSHYSQERRKRQLTPLRGYKFNTTTKEQDNEQN